MESGVRIPLRPYLSLLIIIATDNAMAVEELKETVCYVNRNELRQEEILSDNVYKFCRSDGNVEII